MNNNNQQIVGYDQQTGQPIYTNQNINHQSNNTIQSNNLGYVPNMGQPIYTNQNVNQQTNNIQPQINNRANYQQPKKKNKSLLWVILGSLVALLVLVIVLINTFSDKKNTRTFMIYMVGADLESKSGMGTFELNGIDPKEVDMENINVVLIAGGSNSWNNNYINKDETSIYELTETGFKKVKAQPIKNMGSANTLSDFLNYSYYNYKSDKYSLLFWNHGGAVDGSEYDELNNNDNLSLIEISSALSNSPFNKNNKLETVIFGTCLNGSLEMENVFKDYANYFVASEEISWSFSNTSDFSFINDVEITDDGADLGVKFIEKYKKKMNHAKWNYKMNDMEYSIYSTYSLVDLNKLNILNESLNEFFKDIDLKKNYNTIAKVRSNLYQYGYEQSGVDLYDMVDLYNLVYNLKELSPTKADKVLDDVEKVVLYNYATNSSSRGISIYFPYKAIDSYQSKLLNNYDDINPVKSYSEFITQFRSLKSNNATSRLSFAQNKSKVKTDDIESDFELELTTEQTENYAKANYLVFRDNKDGTYLPVYKGTEVSLINNKLKAKIRDRQLKIIDSSYQRIITLIEDESTKDYIKYSTYGLLNDLSSNEIYEWKNDNVKINILLDKKTNKIEITDALLMNKNNLPSKIRLDLSDYTSLELGSSSYRIFNGNNEFNENWDDTSNGIFEGIEIDLKEDYKIELEDYSDGYDYYCTFKIYDVNNNFYYSPLVKMG